MIWVFERKWRNWTAGSSHVKRHAGGRGILLPCRFPSERSIQFLCRSYDTHMSAIETTRATGICRICHESPGEASREPLIRPCNCKGKCLFDMIVKLILCLFLLHFSQLQYAFVMRINLTFFHCALLPLDMLLSGHVDSQQLMKGFLSAWLSSFISISHVVTFEFFFPPSVSSFRSTLLQEQFQISLLYVYFGTLDTLFLSEH